MSTTLETDVLIVGAGPTGLMLANCLARLGVRWVLLDGKSEPTRQSRALVHQARTMEIYDQLGIVDRVLAEAEVVSAIVPGFESRRFGSVNLRRLATGVTPYPHLYVLEQSKTERLFADNLARLGGRVHWSHPLRELRLTEDGGVECTTGGAEIGTVRARYCVGADGSSSTVRAMVSIAFEGTTNPHMFYVTDATDVQGLPTGSINVRLGVRDFLLAFPMGGHADQRLLGVVRKDAAAVTEAITKKTLHRVFGVTYPASRWFSTYHVHHRVAARFRSGPVFLAGDAAHVHSPVGAQGMNTGLQDAHNLACKISDVLTGNAEDRYLDRYGAERRPVARRLVTTTDALFGFITSDRRIPRAVRSSVVRLLAPVAAASVPRFVRSPRIFEYVSQTRIHYWMSDAARSQSHGRRGKVVGRRLPWNGDNYESLRAMTWQLHAYGIVDPQVVEGIAQRLDLPLATFRQVRNNRIRNGTCYLVRPDGFVAAESRPETAEQEFAAHRTMIARR